MKTFCERLKELRIENKLSTIALGQKLNVSGPTISRWENGKIIPGIDDLVNIANFFKVSPNYLLGFED